jgi:hypothetical protein
MGGWLVNYLYWYTSHQIRQRKMENHQFERKLSDLIKGLIKFHSYKSESINSFTLFWMVLMNKRLDLFVFAASLMLFKQQFNLISPCSFGFV